MANKNFRNKIILGFLGIILFIMVIGVAAETKPFKITDTSTYYDNLDPLTKTLTTPSSSLGDIKAVFITKWPTISQPDQLKIWEKATPEQRKILFNNFDYDNKDDNKKKLLLTINSDTAKKDKYFSDLWKAFEKDGKLDEASLTKINDLLKTENMKEVKESFNGAVLKDKFESVKENKDKNKKITFEGFGNSKVELTSEGNIKFEGGRVIKANEVISSASKVKLNADGKTVEYTLKFKDGSTLNVNDAGDGRLTDKGYVNGKNKVEFEYPFGKGRENVKIESKGEGAEKRNVYTLTGEGGRSVDPNDRNAMRYVRKDSAGKELTYFVRANDATGEVSFSIGENGDLKNEGQNSFNVLIPYDKYVSTSPQTSDVLKSSYTIGAGASVQFKDTPIDNTNMPGYDSNANLVIIGKDSVFISSPKSSVTVVSYDNALANGIIALTDVKYYGSDGVEWIRTQGSNAFIKRMQIEPNEVAAADSLGNERYAQQCSLTNGCKPGGQCGPGQQCPSQPRSWEIAPPGRGQPGQQSPGAFLPAQPSPDPSNPVPNQGSQSQGLVPGMPQQTQPGAGFVQGGQQVNPGWYGGVGQQIQPQQGQQGPGGQIGGCPGGGCPGGGGGSEGYGGRQYRFPRLRAFFGRIFGRRR